jgi:hypothetical protein
MIMLAPVTWQFNRTSAPSTVIDQTLNAAYAENAAELAFSVQLGSYREPGPEPTYTLNFEINFSAEAMSSEFSVKSVLLTFGNDSQPSQIWLPSELMSLENLTLKASADGYEAGALWLGSNTQDGIGCQLSARGYWFLETPNSVSSHRQIDLQTIYYNGSAYERVTQPFDLTLLGS